MKRKIRHLVILSSLLVSTAYYLSHNSVEQSRLALANDVYNPNMEGFAETNTEKVAWGTLEIIIGAGIGIINPIAGVAYSL